MRRFVWRLQRVLDIKTKAEQIKRAELLELTEKLAQTRAKLMMQRRILKDIISDIADENPKKRLEQQEFFLKWVAASDESIRKLEKEERELEAQQRAKITEVLKLRRFKEGLEKLRDKARMQFIEEQEKIEQKELDEGAVITFARRIIQQNIV
jgi:flagellar biosynthesis chaperone FliJ